MTIADALRDATVRLAATAGTPRLDAELLMAHALGIGREALLLGDRSGAAPAAFGTLVARRLAHEPVAYIVGRRAFWTIEFAVTPDVLIPRPETETLIEAALDHFRGRDASPRAPGRILDLGTGSGALLLAALSEWPDASGVGIDRSAAALAVARGNAVRLGLVGRASFAEGDWRGDPQADLILCNPPYIGTDEPLPPDVARYEPASALFAGADGLDDYRRIAGVLVFAEGGCACVEIGARQGETAAALFRAAGFLVQARKDLAGHDRCLLLTRR